MKKLFFIFSIIALIAIFGCQKTGPVGPAGATGAAGSSVIIAVDTFTIGTADWTQVTSGFLNILEPIPQLHKKL